MSALSFIASPGKALEAFADAVLPKELEFVGDLLSMAANLKTGNWGAALFDAVDLAENVLSGDLAPAKLKEGLKNLLSPQFAQLIEDLIDPGPPPPSQAQSQREARVTGGLTSFGGQEHDEKLDPAGGLVPDIAAEKSAAAVESTGTTNVTSRSTKPSGKSKSGRSTRTASSNTRTSTTKTAKAATPKKTAGSGKAGVEGKLAKYNDAELLEMVRKGNIPDEITKDQGAMQGLQQRLHDIQQMNALLTNLARALHEMQMETIRNLRA